MSLSLYIFHAPFTARNKYNEKKHPRNLNGSGVFYLFGYTALDVKGMNGEEFFFVSKFIF